MSLSVVIRETWYKTGEPVFWPIPEPLATILADAGPHGRDSCASSWVRPGQGGFSASWLALQRDLRRKERSGGDQLYTAFVTRSGRPPRERLRRRTIADALGQKTTAMARHYAKGADLRGKMRGVVKDFNAELAKRRGPK